nr:VCBS repeat-containing protein [Shewanella algae]
MDGDGLSDIVYVRDGRWYKRGIQSGIEQAMASTGAGKAAYAQTIDYDGDGQRDLLVANSETANWQILSFKPSTYQHTVCEPNGRGTQLCEDVERVVNYTLKDLGLKAIGLEGKALVADVNGDALEDIIFIDGGAIKWYRNLGNGSFAAAQSLYSFPSTEVGHNTSVHQWHSSRGFGSSFMDINGDGLTDFMLEVREREAVCISGSGKVISGVTENECRMDIRGTWSVSDYEYWNLYVSTGSSYQRRQKIYRGHTIISTSPIPYAVPISMVMACRILPMSIIINGLFNCQMAMVSCLESIRALPLPILRSTKPILSILRVMAKPKWWFSIPRLRRWCITPTPS